MNIVQYLSAFRIFSPSVLLLAAGVNLICSLLKKTVLKKCNKKLFVFLPFVFGLGLYAAFRAIAAGVCTALAYNLSVTLEGGFACGSVATLYYVAYEQFFRKKQTEINPVSPLLEGYVLPEKVDEVARKLLAETSTKEQGERLDFIVQTLKDACDESVSEEEIFALAKLVEEFLQTLTTE